MFNVVLVAPEIPANTGNIGRTCVVTGSRLHLVGPLGFSLDEKSLHRAGLGYWGPKARLHLLTKKARRTYAEAHYQDGDYLVFGCESVGLPEELLAAHTDLCERIPMLPDATSLKNASTWGAPGNHDTLLAQDVCGNFVNPDDYRISALNLSNAAAVVLYEALRQTGFKGM